jgi:hypothetical protein
MSNAQTGRIEVAQKPDFEELYRANRTTMFLNVTVSVSTTLRMFIKLVTSTSWDVKVHVGYCWTTFPSNACVLMGEFGQ